MYTIYVYYIYTMYIPRGMELKEKEAYKVKIKAYKNSV